MVIIYQALNQLVDDYYKCENLLLKKQILSEIQFLTDIVCLCD